jgi:ABC-type amino acid transport system permease subunit
VLTYGAVAVAFILINYSLSKFAEYLERRLARRGQKPLDAEVIEPGTG